MPLIVNQILRCSVGTVTVDEHHHCFRFATFILIGKYIIKALIFNLFLLPNVYYHVPHFDLSIL